MLPSIVDLICFGSMVIIAAIKIEPPTGIKSGSSCISVQVHELFEPKIEIGCRLRFRIWNLISLNDSEASNFCSTRGFSTKIRNPDSHALPARIDPKLIIPATVEIPKNIIEKQMTCKIQANHDFSGVILIIL